MKRRLGPLAFVLAACVVACQLIAGIEQVAKVDPSSEGGSDSGAPADPCVHVVPPDRPQTDDAPLDQVKPFIIAVRTVDLIPRDSQNGIRGFDLDGVCTCDKRPFTADDGGAACRVRDASTITCDGDGGVDNQAGLLFKSRSDVLDINKGAGLSDAIDQGRQTLLIYLSGYNGLANDREVNVGVFLSQGIQSAPPPPGPGCTTTSTGLDGGTFTPTWCGSDPWTIAKGSVTLTQKPLIPIRTGPGWVNDYRLVASIGGGDVPVPFGQLVVNISATSIVGTIVPLGEDLQPRGARPPASDLEKRLFRLDDGFVTGRLAASELLAVVGTLPDPGKLAPHLCGDPFLFGTVRDQICGQLDIPRTVDRDLNTTIDCDALSFAFGFTAFPALDGTFVDLVETPNECRPGPDGIPDAMPDVSYACPK